MGQVDAVQAASRGASALSQEGRPGPPDQPGVGGNSSLGSVILCLAPDPMALRPATVLRQQRLLALLAELASHPMDIPAVAGLLDCSPRAARNYLGELVQAEVVMLSRGERSEKGRPRSGYCLISETAARTFLAHLDASPAPRVKLLRGKKRATSARTFGSRHFHIIGDDQYLDVNTSEAAIRRDPLVAALFGKDSTHKDAVA